MEDDKPWWQPSNDGTDEPIVNWIDASCLLWGGILSPTGEIDRTDWPQCPFGMANNDNREIRAVS